MSRKDHASNLGEIDSKRLLLILAVIIACSVVALGTTFFAYFTQFSGGFSSRQDVWGQFGDFVGGVLNPILSFLALIALVLTVVLQSRQLEYARKELDNSREELAATRIELKRSANAQHQTAAALVEQSTMQH
jgi:uncharacterized membrane protein